LPQIQVHVLLRYYESQGKTRADKVKDTLETMGASIFVGGMSTLLGVIPLWLSTSSVLQTVFTCFFAMIALGVTHGLVLLPVVLSMCGPTNSVYFSGFVESSGDLDLKPNAESDTDDSDSEDESAKKAISDESKRSLKPLSPVASPRYAEVLESHGTFRDESLEVLRWNPNKMAMI
jgi:Patched family